VRRDLDLPAIKIELSPLVRRRLDNYRVAFSWCDRFGFGFSFLDGRDFAIRRDLLFCDPSWITIEARVGKEAGGRASVLIGP
jgi:hypothetical protein